MISPTPRTTFIFDFDSTLVSVESLDELIKMSLVEEQGAAKAQETLRKISAITDAGMEGDMDLSESMALRLSAARIHRKHVEKFTATLVSHITPGMEAIIRMMQQSECPIFVLSGAINACVLPVASKLSIPDTSVFANTAVFDSEGYLTRVEPGMLTRSQGKIDCLQMLRDEGRLLGKTVMIGDGVSDLLPYLEGVVDEFIGIGIHRIRDRVLREAPYFCTSINALADLIPFLLSL